MVIALQVIPAWIEAGSEPPQERRPVPPGGLTVRQLRELPLRAAVQAAYELLNKMFKHESDPDSIGGPDHFSAAAAAAPRRPGRRGRDDNFYAKLALDYVKACERSSSPVKAMAETLGGAYSDVCVRDLLSEARRRGLLTRPPARGVAGGELTEKGWQALGEERS